MTMALRCSGTILTKRLRITGFLLKEVEDHRLPPQLAATLFITFEVDVYEDFAGVGIEKYEAGNLVCYLSEENSKVVKACRRLYGDRGWQPDVTQNPLWLFSDRPRPLRDVLHVEARDPLHVAGREAVQVERQAQRPTLRREGAVHPHIIVAHRNMTRDREGVYLWQIEFPPGQSDRRSEESAACGAHLVRRSYRYRRIPSFFLCTLPPTFPTDS